jgi:hypothetical protein
LKQTETDRLAEEKERIQVNRQTDIETDRQTDSETDRQTDRQTV